MKRDPAAVFGPPNMGLVTDYQGALMPHDNGANTMRYQFLGYIIERGAFGWYVLDWDFETEKSVGPIHKSKSAAEQWCCNHS